MNLISLSEDSKWIDIQQNTDEWLDIRMGRVGGSSIGKVMANFGKAFGKPAHDTALKIALEKLTGTRQEQTYTNEHMERGHEQEPIARSMYEDITFSDVTNGGYFKCGDLLGVSPDGLCDDGLIEIKCVIGSVHFDTIKRDSFDPKYKWQLLYNMGCSGRPWVDYVEYCAEFPEGKKLFIKRVFAKDYIEDLKKVLFRLNEFNTLVYTKIKTIENIK